MDQDLKKVKEIFLKGVDEEDYAENLAQIVEWEQQIRASQDFLSWQESDVTVAIIKQGKETYKDLSMLLINNRNLTEQERMAIYARQDAFVWLLSLADINAKATLEGIHAEIKMALKVE